MPQADLLRLVPGQRPQQPDQPGKRQPRPQPAAGRRVLPAVNGPSKHGDLHHAKQDQGTQTGIKLRVGQ